MSVPNPKRSVPVNFYNLSDEDSFSPFIDETAAANPAEHHLSANDSIDHGPSVIGSKGSKVRRPGTGTSTPEIFEFFNDNGASSNDHQYGVDSSVGHTFDGPVSTNELERTRGVIGSARKSKSSNSNNESGWTPMKSPGVLEALGGDRNSEFGGAHALSFQQLAPARSASLSPVPPGTEAVALGAGAVGPLQPGPGSSDRWDSLRRPQAPICRPSSTPVYSSSMSSLFGGDSAFSLDLSPPARDMTFPLPQQQQAHGHGHGAHPTDGPPSDLFSALSLGRGVGAPGIGGVRGRDREYSFGSLLGLGDGAGGAGHSNIRQFGNNNVGINSHPHGINSSAEERGNYLQLFPGESADLFSSQQGRGSQIRSSLLSAGGTMSAPPQFLISQSAYPPLELSARHVGGSSRNLTPPPAGSGSAAPYLTSLSRGHSPGPAHVLSDPTRGRSPITVPLTLPLQQQQDEFQGAEGGAMSVEATVLRSCREILAGAADHSLKAVELANTLRARVGTESLARVREQWGGLLSLLEKHSAHFRVDRIPKNDKVTLLQGGSGQDLGALTSFDHAGAASVHTRRPAATGLVEPNAVHSPQFGNGYTSSGASNPGSSYSTPSAAGATRCLHVGNVPANMTEVQLVREFEKFGQLDGLKLVSQRNGTRRFAFITFHTVEQAISARHCLSKVHPWKSAISFAHKEFSTVGSGPNSGVGQGSVGNAGSSGSAHLNHYAAAAGGLDGYGSQQHQMQMNMNMLMHNQQHLGVPNSNLYQQGLPEYQNSMLFHMQNNHQMLLAQQQQYPYLQYPGAGGLTNSAGNGAPAMFWLTQQFPSNLSSPITAPLQAPHPFAHHMQPQHMQLPPQQQQQQQQVPSFAAGITQQPLPPSVDRDCPVLQRLCDDTYVPTQPWPVDPARDQLYCSAVIAQLQQFGGCTTISKLRGFLRNRVSAVDNIKSVPLKAMLVAYPQHFILENNYVYLVNTEAAGAGGAGTATYASTLGYNAASNN